MIEPDLPWRPEFLAALRMLARASEGLAQRGFSRPVLVGGGAVEFYTGSAIMTGDIDVTTPVQPELEEELQKLGFVRPSGPARRRAAGCIRTSASASKWSATAQWATRPIRSAFALSIPIPPNQACACSRSKT